MLTELFLGASFLLLILRLAIPNPETYRWVIADFLIAFFAIMGLFYTIFPTHMTSSSTQYIPAYNVIANGNVIQYPAYNTTTNSTATSAAVPLNSGGFILLVAFGIAMLIFASMLGLRDFIFASQTHQW